MEEKELDLLEGTVDSVIFRSEEDGYTVLRLTVGDREPVTVVGCMPGAAPGEGLAVHGAWGRHASYGEQFQAQIVERRVPVGVKAIQEYLASGAIKGVGASTARRLVAEFGEDTLTVLEEHPEYLTRIKGITRKRALQIGEDYRLQQAASYGAGVARDLVRINETWYNLVWFGGTATEYAEITYTVGGEPLEPCRYETGKMPVLCSPAPADRYSISVVYYDRAGNEYR